MARHHVCFTALLLGVLLGGCAGCPPSSTTETRDAASGEPACRRENHCILGADNLADCEPGYTWANPDDPTDFTCVCAPLSASESCERAGRTCGEAVLSNGCGDDVPVACGECSMGSSCNPSGQCAEGPCVAEDDATFCARLGVTCGMRTAADNCGTTRTTTCGSSCDAGANPGRPDGGTPILGGPAEWPGEFEVEDPVHGEAGESSELHVLDVGTHYLALWQDGRSDLSGWSISDAIMAARVSRDGTVLDPGGIMVLEPGSNRSLGDVVQCGDRLVMLLTEYVDQDLRTVHAMVLDLDGKQLGTRPVTSGDIGLRTVRCAGSNALIAWARYDMTGEAILDRVLHPTTMTLDEEHIVAAPGRGGALLSLASVGDHFMASWVGWEAGTMTHHLRVTAIGVDGVPVMPGGVDVADPEGDLVVNAYLQPHAMWPTPDVFVLIHDHPVAQSMERRLSGSFFSVDATLQTASPVLLVQAPANPGYGGFFAESAIAAGSTIVTFNAMGGRQWLRVGPGGSPVSMPSPLGTSGAAYNLSCSTEGCVQPEQEGSLPSRTYFQRYTPQLVPVGERIAAATCANHQLAPRVAFDGQHYLVAWLDIPSEERVNVPDTPTLRARRLNPDGTWADAVPIAVPTTETLYWGHRVTAYPGGGFLVAWNERIDFNPEFLVVRRMRADGSWAWPAPIRLDVYSQYGLSFGGLACAAENCLVLYGDMFTMPLKGLLLDGNGAQIGQPISIAGVTSDGIGVDVRAEGNAFLLAFSVDNMVHVRSLIASGPNAGQPGADSDDTMVDAAEERSGAQWMPWDQQWVVVSNAVFRDAAWMEGFYRTVEARPFVAGQGLGDVEQWVRMDPNALQWLGGVARGDTVEGFLSGYSDTRMQMQTFRYTRGGGPVTTLTPFQPDGWFQSVSFTGDLMGYVRVDWTVGFGDERVRLYWAGNRSALKADGAMCLDDGQCAGGRCRRGTCCDACALWKGP